MADAKKCDRCGKYYDENDRKLWLYNYQGMRNNKSFDLCLECATDLERWFNKDVLAESDE